MVTGNTLPYIKEIQKGNLLSNFRPIIHLPLIWNLLTGILAEELYKHLEKKQIHHHDNKREAGKEAEAQNINY